MTVHCVNIAHAFHSNIIVALGMCRLPAISLLAKANSEITPWTENSRSSIVLKIDIPSVTDANKNKNKHVGKREVN